MLTLRKRWDQTFGTTLILINQATLLKPDLICLISFKRAVAAAHRKYLPISITLLMEKNPLAFLIVISLINLKRDELSAI